VISIVDDDVSFRGAIAGLIQELGYAVAAFGSAEEFLDSGRVDDTACLISDVRMPGMSGIELQSQLLADGRRFPIIFVAADPAPRLQRQALAAGAVAFLGKPFSEQRLISCLEQALARPEGTSPSDLS
jgi:FixJ family two-component response regulator